MYKNRCNKKVDSFLGYQLFSVLYLVIVSAYLLVTIIFLFIASSLSNVTLTT